MSRTIFKYCISEILVEDLVNSILVINKPFTEESKQIVPGEQSDLGQF